uniref:MFS transporter n=1 Tax=Mycobacterium sp. UM_Kg1 TaxID=1545691 RepID=UPI00061B04FF
MSTDPVGSAVGRSTLRKVTRRLIPFVALLYFVNYLDRVNIGFAGPNGMNAALGMSATMFGFASGVFFFGYLLLEVPSNIALHRFGARRWLARIMLTWGIVSTAIAFVPNAATLVALRFLLGVAEAGFFPGIIFYLTLWFPAEQRARAVSLFMVAVPVSTAIGATLSSLVIDWGHGIFGLDGWRFMFLVEGLPAIALAFACWFYLTDHPAAASWLDTDERRWLETTLADERAAAQPGEHWPLKKTLRHPQVLTLAFVYFGIVYGLYAVGFFLPTILSLIHI